jgi:N-acetylated-alpha-linked acidic dipeptidase
VAYINSDGNSRGFIGAAGSHSLEPFFNEIVTQVTDPQTGVTINERRYAQTLVTAPETNRARLIGNKSIKLSALGAGSDYSPFLQHLGIISMNLGFGGEGQGGEYHSIYDSYDLFRRFKDPGFQYGVALSKTAGRVMLRLCNADVLPVDCNSFYKTVADYATELKTLIDNMRSNTELQNRMINEKLYELARDPKKNIAAPKIKEPVPFLNFSQLDNTLAQLKSSVEELQKLYPKAVQLPADKQKQLNTLLYTTERKLLQEKGLPRRSWYRHQVYAPGYYTGYGVKTLPGIREGIEERQWQEAQENIGTVTQTLQTYISHVNEMNALLK